jgi:hypothetical protein
MAGPRLLTGEALGHAEMVPESEVPALAARYAVATA